MRTIAICFLLVTVYGCTQEPTATGTMATARSMNEVIAGPISEADIQTVTGLMNALPPDQRPSFQPALEPISTDGLSAVEILRVFRRNYLAALEVDAQAAAWKSDQQLVGTCKQFGISLDNLALLLTRIGCAHHAAESGTVTDVATVRAEGEAKIADLLPQIEAAQSELERDKLIDSLGTIVAFDTYLTLLDLVPEANRAIVGRHRDALSVVLPPTPEIDIRPRTPNQTANRRLQAAPR